MSAKKSHKSQPLVKSTVKKRTLNYADGPAPGGGAPFRNQDAKRRLGAFETAGEHARQGARGRIIGQTKRRWTTDKKK